MALWRFLAHLVEALTRVRAARSRLVRLADDPECNRNGLRMTRTGTSIPTYLHLLDVVRGIAALSVVLWHWQHFFFAQGVLPVGFDRAGQPLYAPLRLFYEHGGLAVDLFFSISGFVFFWLYSDRIRQGSVSGREFFVLRASRLYPLHALTLLLVLTGQWLYQRNGSGPFVYAHNDAYHFALNLLFLQSVGLEHGYSYNAPTWSVSVEVVLYAAFFFVCRSATLPLLATISAFGFFLLIRIYAPLGEGVGSFFAGGCCYLLYVRIMCGSHAYRITAALSIAAVLCWAAVLAGVYAHVDFGAIPGAATLVTRFPQGVLFPLTVLALALAESVWQLQWKFFSALGDISYSSYLWHFPLQLAAAYIAAMAGWPSRVFATPTALLLFFAILIPLSFASHRLFELPMQRVVRDWCGIGRRR